MIYTGQGVIRQFNLTFELAWKTLQDVMRKHGKKMLLRDFCVKFCSLVINLASASNYDLLFDSINLNR